jgi:hypothetical protein
VHRAVVQHDLSALAELAVDYPQQPMANIEVATVKADRFPEA